jgi:hypothetical protein
LIWNVHKLACKLVLELAKNEDAILYDGNSLQYFSKDYWKKYKVDHWKEKIPFIPYHIMYFFIANEKTCDATTSGMDKFGLPEISINKVSCAEQMNFQYLVYLCCQQIAEQGHIKKKGILNVDIESLKNEQVKSFFNNILMDNATGKASLDISIEEDSTTTESRILEITFKTYASKNRIMKQMKTLREIFGYKEPRFQLNQTKEIELIVDSIKKEIPNIKTEFKKGYPLGKILYLNFPFPTIMKDPEWLWIEVEKWEGNMITGILQNKPDFIKDLALGSRVTKYESEIFDYIIKLPDGSRIGNRTEKYMKER